jgi:pimeloyl-ACP methyl ester carboxylesterase
MENRVIMKGVMHGGFVNKSALPDDFIAELRKSGRRKGYARVARAVYRSLKGFEKARDRYRDVSVPVTLVYSEHDWARPTERDHVAGLLTEVQRITLPDTGHFSALERPNEMARILLAR